MDDAQAGALLKAIYAYQAGEEAELDGAISFVFDLIRDKFEDDAAKYERQCQQKAENGRLGGLAKLAKIAQPSKVYMILILSLILILMLS